MHRNDTALHDELVDVLNVLIAEAPKAYELFHKSIKETSMGLEKLNDLNTSLPHFSEYVINFTNEVNYYRDKWFEEHHCKAWCDVDPHKFLIMPNEKEFYHMLPNESFAQFCYDISGADGVNYSEITCIDDPDTPEYNQHYKHTILNMFFEPGDEYELDDQQRERLDKYLYAINEVISNMQELRYFLGQHHLQSCYTYTEECQETIIDDFVNYCVDELRSEFEDVHDMLLDLFDEHGEELRANEPVMQSLKDVIKCFETCGNDAKVWFTQTYDTKLFNVINEHTTLAEMKNVLEKAEEQLAINEQ